MKVKGDTQLTSQISCFNPRNQWCDWCLFLVFLSCIFSYLDSKDCFFSLVSPILSHHYLKVPDLRFNLFVSSYYSENLGVWKRNKNNKHWTTNFGVHEDNFITVLDKSFLLSFPTFEPSYVLSFFKLFKGNF